MEINKASGFTETEKNLSEICEKTFLNIWSYANPFNEQGKEFCDVIALFENHMFIFFDRNKKLDFVSDDDFHIKWNRWTKNVIDAQINTCYGAERYIKNGRKLYLDSKMTMEFPLRFDVENLIIHKIIVAHGAKEACLKFSGENINGSIGMHYGIFSENAKLPFYISLPKENPVHVFDSHNLEIILGELDTFYDFTNYIMAKENAIKENIFISYCGEEDLLAYYFMNFDQDKKKHYIGQKDCMGFVLDQGIWNEFIKSPAYLVRKQEDKISYFWDELIKEIGKNALKGKLQGNGNVFLGNSGIYEMAKEPRFMRRMLSQNMIEAIKNFPKIDSPIGRFIRVMTSYYKDVNYVFLQYKFDIAGKDVNDEDIKKMRQYFLEVACASTKIISFPDSKKIIGIGMAPLKYYPRTNKDILLMDFATWNDEMEKYYLEENKLELNRFHLTGKEQYKEFHAKEFPESKLKNE